ncbi:S9 family peptidase [uncultured Friedmanniella sp.]|uniref:S9 family peptidase n=1 Tax=uncultured Friedmanniella sp. TaxID=335381 RepID=UPI0035CC0ECE
MSAETNPWHNLQDFVALPRLTDLVTGPGGEVVVATATLDADATGYRSAWWQLDVTGATPPRVLTRSVEGEGAAAYLPDGRFLFTSKRAVPAGPAVSGSATEERRALWCLPAGGGEAYELTSRDGGWSSVTTARDSARVVLGADLMPAATTVADDEAVRAARRDRKITALLHEAGPVRHWDHDLGPGEPRLLTADLGDVAAPGRSGPGLEPDRLQVLAIPGRALDSTPHLDASGRWAVVTWSLPVSRGGLRTSVALLDLEQPGAEPRILAAADEEHDFHSARLSADGRQVVCVRRWRGTAEEPADQRLYLVDVATGEGAVLAADWDRWPSPETFSADGSVVYVTVDENGQAPVYAVEVADGRRRRRLTDLGAHTSVRLSHDGKALYALRSDYTDPGSVVAIDLGAGAVTVLPRPVEYPILPGRMENIEVFAADGTRVRGYLLTPTTAARSSPAPLVLWAHGGPFSSWNCWSWRWCPWLLVAQGYAVLLPDPALSTGYGQAMIARGWTDWGGTPYTDLMTITDLVVQRPDIDAGRTAAMGGSFGGYLMNWFAGHTDRFGCLVSHASLWDLESFLRTTDSPWAWETELTPGMRASSSPSAHADQIRTPMLVVHGDRDYRVPISEGLGLWRALVTGFDGPPEELPHRFLYFPEENHWVLSPQHAVVWYEAVLSFLDTHLRGGNFTRPAAL